MSRIIDGDRIRVDPEKMRNFIHVAGNSFWFGAVGNCFKFYSYI